MRVCPGVPRERRWQGERNVFGQMKRCEREFIEVRLRRRAPEENGQLMIGLSELGCKRRQRGACLREQGPLAAYVEFRYAARRMTRFHDGQLLRLGVGETPRQRICS